MHRRLVAAVAVPVAILLGAAAPVPQGSKAPAARPVPGDSSLLSARETAWRDYFSGNKNLGVVLPPDFVAIHSGDTGSVDRAQTLEGSKSSAASGTKLVRLVFPRNIIQRRGDVAVIHSRYEGTLRDEKGKTGQMKGWITEMFFWDGTKWIHPSWHMSEDPKR